MDGNREARNDGRPKRSATLVGLPRRPSRRPRPDDAASLPSVGGPGGVEQRSGVQPEPVRRVTEASIARARTNVLFREHLKADPDKAVGEIVHELGLEPADEKEARELRARAVGELRAVPVLEREDLAGMISTLMKDAQSAFYSTVGLSKCLFWFGIVVVGGTLIAQYSLQFLDPKHETVLPAILGGGAGAMSLICALLKNPLDKVQNSAGNLAQLEMAVLGYVDQLDVLMTRPPAGSMDDAIKAARAIRVATKGSLDMLQRFAEEHPE